MKYVTHHKAVVIFISSWTIVSYRIVIIVEEVCTCCLVNSMKGDKRHVEVQTLLTNVDSVQSVTNERTTTQVHWSPVDNERSDAADETPPNTGLPAHQTGVPVATDVQFLARSDLS